ncbi:MAG: extracellular solute-binding protein [Acidobacteria bacterium]|nr:extracellular solute-binding protein [Acidobacteriota bacterium]
MTGSEPLVSGSLMRRVRAGLILGPLYLFLYAPLFVLATYSFNQSRLTAVWRGFTWEWYAVAWRDEALIQSLRVSLRVAMLVTLITTTLGTLAAWALRRRRLPGRTAIESLFMLPAVIPEIVIAFSTVVLFSLVRLHLGAPTIVLAHVAFCLPYVLYVVAARLERLDPRLEEAAVDLGASPLQAFWYVSLPLLQPALASGALLVFTLSLDDYLITSFVAGEQSTTLPLQIYAMLKSGISPEINAISTVLLIATGLLIAAAIQLDRGKAGKVTIAAAGAALVGILVFAAGGGSTDGTRATLNLFIWSNYTSPKAIAEFEKRYQAKVNIQLYDSNEALLAKLDSGAAQYDIIVPGDYMVRILSRRGLLRPLDKNQLTHIGNLDPELMGLPYDPENRFSVPYLWGTTGIGYRRDKVSGPVDSWASLWDRQYRERITMLDDIRENFAAALKWQGRSLNSVSPTEIEEAYRTLLAQKPLLRAYDSASFDQLLLSGDAWLAHGYNGQVVKAQREDPRIEYVVPREGATLAVDNLCIPSNALHPDLALLFINLMLEAPIAAEITNHTGYPTANLAARPLITPALRNHPGLFPPPEVLARCELISDLGPVLALYDRYWTELKSR